MMELFGPQLLGILAALITAGFIFELLRRGILPERFAALWLLVALALIILAGFPGILSWAAKLVGIEVPSNLLFFMTAVLLLLVSVQLSYEVSKLEARTRRLAEDLALLSDDVEQLKSDREQAKPDEG